MTWIGYTEMNLTTTEDLKTRILETQMFPKETILIAK